ncbi:centrosome-associated protein 350-like [Protopterus annectens]|uniref:centrosome-associated protein 350-like n=1 Tax=Protopterus annectens TaxID=7888 RepID=UPI001CF9C2D4|nr:centrosome-associated protein 350-like [Protopterus annectens]
MLQAMKYEKNLSPGQCVKGRRIYSSKKSSFSAPENNCDQQEYSTEPSGFPELYRAEEKKNYLNLGKKTYFPEDMNEIFTGKASHICTYILDSSMSTSIKEHSLSRSPLTNVSPSALNTDNVLYETKKNSPNFIRQYAVDWELPEYHEFISRSCISENDHDNINKELSFNSPEDSFYPSPVFDRGRSCAKRMQILRKHSPCHKLEKLKAKIRKQRQQKSFVEELNKSNPVPEKEIVNRDSIKQTVRKVTAAPPPPVYKGFSSVRVDSGKLQRKDEINSNANDERNDVQDDSQCNSMESPKQEQNISSKKSSKEKRRQDRFSRSRSPKRTTNSSNSSTIDAFSWRKGQKLVRLLLGPPPKSPWMNDPACRQQFHICSNKAEKNEKTGATCDSTMKEKRMCDDNNMLTRNQYPAKNGTQAICSTARVHFMERSHSSEEIHKQDLAGAKNMSPPSNTKMYCETQRGQEIRNEERTISWERKKASLSPARKHIKVTKQRPNSASPSRCWKGLCIPDNNAAEKEKLNDISENKVALRVSKYNISEVREFMNKKQNERRRKELEKKRSLKEAEEKKRKSLQELHSKQKEALKRKQKALIQLNQDYNAALASTDKITPTWTQTTFTLQENSQEDKRHFSLKWLFAGLYSQQSGFLTNTATHIRITSPELFIYFMINQSMKEVTPK